MSSCILLQPKHSLTHILGDVPSFGCHVSSPRPLELLAASCSALSSLTQAVVTGFFFFVALPSPSLSGLPLKGTSFLGIYPHPVAQLAAWAYQDILNDGVIV